jgi:hypothetical protein
MDIFQATLISLFTCTVAVPACAEGLCIAAETTIFNCELQKSTASLCKSNQDGTLIYRNGTDGKINMQLSDVGKSKNIVFFFSNVPYAGGGEAHIRFTRSSYTYYLYDKTTKASAGPEFSAGIAIYKDRRKISDLACQNDASIRATAYKSITREPYRSIDSQ